MDPLCKALTNLLTIDNPNEEKTKIDMRLESIGKVFAELMDVLEKKNIVKINLYFALNQFYKLFKFYYLGKH